MKRAIAIFFLFTFLYANTVFSEVLKLPVLVQHYWEHSKKENNISFFEFIKNHYSNKSTDPINSSHHHHEKLPFKSVVHQGGQMFSVIPPFIIGFAKIIHQEDKTPRPGYKQNNYTNNYLSQIWQPPRM